MLPAPPRLANKVDYWTEEQLFWLVENGLKYTGMPFWSGTGRADEVWTVVAFLRQMPALDVEGYEALTLGNAREFEDSAGHLVARGDIALQLAACDRCHDTSSAGAISALVPRLGGQSREYIAQSLRQYHADKRQSGMMEPVAAELDDQRITRLAHYYSTLRSPIHSNLAQADQQSVVRGRHLAQQGDTSRGLPACAACHGDDKLPVYPRLTAQPAPYTEAQLVLWQGGGRSQTPTGALMAEIAQRMTQQQIVDVSAYYQEQSPPLPDTKVSL
jgi:cytochrome c553